MLAYLRSPAFLALAPAALVGAYDRPQALLAMAFDAVMLAYLRSPAFLALALDALVWAYARPQKGPAHDAALSLLTLFSPQTFALSCGHRSCGHRKR